MANRIITATVTGETIKLSNKTAGAAGSFNAVSLSLTFDSAWDGTTKKLYFFDAYGNNAVYRLLTTELLVDGAYIVPIPAEPLAYAGEMTITIRGVDFATDGTTAERIIMSASTTMKALSAIAPASDVAPVEPTPTQAEQLQGEIDGIKGDIATVAASASTIASSVSAASASASAAANSATAAATSATAAQTAQTASESARDAAVSAKTAAQTAETNAETAQTAAETARTGAQTAETNAGTYATNAGNSALAASDSATTAVNAKNDAETAKTAAELAETHAKTSETNAETAHAAAELALTHAPYIDDTTGNWFIWNATTSVYVDSGTYATGAVYQAEAPTGVVLWIDSDDDAISSVTKADIGLANVDNTSDANKPISTATQTALNAKVATSAIVNDLTTGGIAVPLSAEQGKVLSTSISTLTTATQFPMTNIISNGDFSNGTTGFTNPNATFNVIDGVAHVTASAKYGGVRQAFVAVSGHKFYFAAKVKSDSSLVQTTNYGDTIKTHSGSNQFEILSGINTAWATGTSYFFVQDNRASGFTEFDVDYMFCSNLTAAFGAGNEPTAAEMDAILAFYPNSWFDGTVNIASNPKILPYLLNATRNRPIMASGTYAARPTSVTFPTLYLSTDKTAGSTDRLTLNVGGTTWLQI